jgi:hypothetical protein
MYTRPTQVTTVDIGPIFLCTVHCLENVRPENNENMVYEDLEPVPGVNHHERHCLPDFAAVTRPAVLGLTWSLLQVVRAATAADCGTSFSGLWKPENT